MKIGQPKLSERRSTLRLPGLSFEFAQAGGLRVDPDRRFVTQLSKAELASTRTQAGVRRPNGPKKWPVRNTCESLMGTRFCNWRLRVENEYDD